LTLPHTNEPQDFSGAVSREISLDRTQYNDGISDCGTGETSTLTNRAIM
jgi:hypothetical protein